MIFDEVGERQGALDLLGEGAGIRGFFHFALQNRKFIAAQAGNEIRFAGAELEAFGDLQQQQISDGMAVGVVDRFELVEIEKEDGKGGNAARGGGKGLREALGEGGPGWLGR
jgi:hypothetical protein